MFTEINTDLTLKHYAYPSIEQFRNVIYNINHKSNFIGLDNDNNPIIDETRKKPILNYIATQKLHGTNSSICIDLKEEIVYYQSRQNVISYLKDNAGFASYMSSIQKELLENIFDQLPQDYSEYDIICIYGEFCGSNIQKGMAISGLDKMFVIFDIRFIKNNEDEKLIERKWMHYEVLKELKFNNDLKIYNIYQFPIYNFTIDFNYPELIQNSIIEQTLAVEENCPVGKYFGKEGIGEGILLKTYEKGYNEAGYWFKSKGLKHSISKVKTLLPVNTEKLSNIKEFIQYAVTENRCKQSIDKLREQNLPLTRNSLGEYLRWIVNDIFKEEMDQILANGFTTKELGSPISNKARIWFFENELNF